MGEGREVVVERGRMWSREGSGSLEGVVVSHSAWTVSVGRGRVTMWVVLCIGVGGVWQHVWSVDGHGCLECQDRAMADRARSVKRRALVCLGFSYTCKYGFFEI